MSIQEQMPTDFVQIFFIKSKIAEPQSPFLTKKGEFLRQNVNTASKNPLETYAQ